MFSARLDLNHRQTETNIGKLRKTQNPSFDGDVLHALMPMSCALYALVPFMPMSYALYTLEPFMLMSHTLVPLQDKGHRCYLFEGRITND